MPERRRFHRYDLQLEANISVYQDHMFQKTEKGKTRNISSGGAFIQTSSRYPLGISLYLEVYLPVQSQARNPQVSKIQGQGRVIRNSSQGFAISFDQECDLVPAACESK